MENELANQQPKGTSLIYCVGQCGLLWTHRLPAYCSALRPWHDALILSGHKQRVFKECLSSCSVPYKKAIPKVTFVGWPPSSPPNFLVPVEEGLSPGDLAEGRGKETGKWDGHVNNSIIHFQLQSRGSWTQTRRGWGFSYQTGPHSNIGSDTLWPWTNYWTSLVFSYFWYRRENTIPTF